MTSFVSKFYEMNPDTEDVISGSELEQGMYVLIEDTIVREDPNRIKDESDPAWDGGYALNRAKENNQWCRVTNLKREGELISFVGVYDDGVKRPRRFNKSYYWIVSLVL